MQINYIIGKDCSFNDVIITHYLEELPIKHQTQPVKHIQNGIRVRYRVSK
jgi:hypothetical protein